MNKNWRKITLGEVLNLRRGHDLPKTKIVKGNYPVIGTSGVLGMHDKFTTDKPCVTVGRSGHGVGRVQYTNNKAWAHNTIMYIDDYKGNFPMYLYFLLVKLQLRNYSGGSAIPTLNRNHIHPIEITLPPLPEQKAIAHILGTLDDKIELNRKMNETLEAMAQALFKSWFVDFDPVMDNALAQGHEIPAELAAKAERRKAVKASGKYKALPKDIQALFPAAFVYNEELGRWIPEGWEVGCLKDLCNQRKTNAKVEDIEETDFYIGLEHIDKKSPFLSRNGLGDDVSSNKSRFNEMDILFGKLRPYFHKVCISPTDGVCSTDILVFYPISENHHSFVFSILFSKDLIDHVNKCSTGTRMPRASAKDILNFPILYSDPIISLFHKMIASNWTKGHRNILNSAILKQKRDLLLSQLISGKTRLPASFIQQFESQTEAVSS